MEDFAGRVYEGEGWSLAKEKPRKVEGPAEFRDVISREKGARGEQLIAKREGQAKGLKSSGRSFKERSGDRQEQGEV